MPEEPVVDARGLACPLPVVKARKALEAAAKGTVVRVLVDNDTARENVERLARNAGCRVESAGEAPLITLSLTVGAKVESAAGAAACSAAAGGRPSVVAYVNKEVMGHGDDTLGRILIKAFFQTLKELSPAPEKVIFVNGGVHLSCEGSPVLPVLQELSEAGVGVVSCGTCLDFFRKKDQVRVGVVSNMYEIVTLLAGADRVVSP